MEKLDKNTLSRYLRREFLFFKEVSSTFDAAWGDCSVDQTESRANGQNVENKKIVVAAAQTAGQGRFGRRFYSPQGGIYFCLRTKIKPLLTVSAAAGVMRAMQKIGFDPRVKWVNDIMLDGKKVCGILAKAEKQAAENPVKACASEEGETEEKEAVIGVGINYCVSEFPTDIKDRAGNLFAVTEGINKFAALVIEEVLAAIEDEGAWAYGNSQPQDNLRTVEKLQSQCNSQPKSNPQIKSDLQTQNLAYYQDRLFGVGREFLLPDGSAAILVGVDENGHLIYKKKGRNDGALETLSCGDIVI